MNLMCPWKIFQKNVIHFSFCRSFYVLTYLGWMSISRTIFLLRDIYHDRGQFTQDRVQRTGDKLQRRETMYRGHDTRNRDVRHGTKGGYIRQRIQFSLHFIRRKPGRWRKQRRTPSWWVNASAAKNLMSRKPQTFRTWQLDSTPWLPRIT